MCTVLAAAPVQAWAGETEAETFSFEQIADMPFYYSSGVGGWAVELIIDKDGSFTGNYHDSEMGDMGDDYPNGTVYECIYHGTFSVDSQTSDKSWTLKVDKLETEDKEGEERIEDEIRYVASKPVGLQEGDTVDLFCPGYPVADLPEDYLFWAHLNVYDPEPVELPFYGIYDEAEESGFVGMEDTAMVETEAMDGMANPWVETDQKDFAKTMGVELNVPDGAEDVIYRLMNGGELGEMLFTLDGTDCTVRCKASESWEDISGLFYDVWDTDEGCTVHGFEGVDRGVKDKDMDRMIRNCMWLDTDAGTMYSVTAEAQDLEGFDVRAIAEAVYAPAAQDA